MPEYTYYELKDLKTKVPKIFGIPTGTKLDEMFFKVEEENGKLFPTKMGKEVFNYLNKNYGRFVSEERTRILQEEMDMVENGREDYLKILNRIYEEIKEIE